MATTVKAKVTSAEVMAELRAAGTEAAAKTYRRHGVRGECFGVSYADLGRIKKRIGSDTALAGELWRTGNHDARVLATMIAEPAEATAAELDAWVRDVDCYVLTGPVARLATRLPDATGLAARWMADDGEWVARSGWHLVSSLATAKNDLADEYFAAFLPEIERRIHSAQNRVREAMNDTLIAIGSRDATLREKALEAARRVGKVAIDHGQTGCKTPDAGPYIEKVWARRAG